MKRIIFSLALFTSVAIVASTFSQPPGGQGGAKQGGKGGPPGQGGKGQPGQGGPGGMGKGMGKFELGSVLPPQAKDQLNLTQDQQKQLASIEADVKSKLSKLLTDDQKKKLENMGPPMGGPGGPGGQGGPGGPPKM